MSILQTYFAVHSAVSDSTLASISHDWIISRTGSAVLAKVRSARIECLWNGHIWSNSLSWNGHIWSDLSCSNTIFSLRFPYSFSRDCDIKTPKYESFIIDFYINSMRIRWESTINDLFLWNTCKLYKEYINIPSLTVEFYDSPLLWCGVTKIDDFWEKMQQFPNLLCRSRDWKRICSFLCCRFRLRWLDWRTSIGSGNRNTACVCTFHRCYSRKSGRPSIRMFLHFVFDKLLKMRTRQSFRLRNERVIKYRRRR